jgi:hypothetical protein
MGKIENVSGCKGMREKKAYEPPRAMRLGEMRNGAGACSPGSGDLESCSGNGNYAEACNSAGNSPA